MGKYTNGVLILFCLIIVAALYYFADPVYTPSKLPNRCSMSYSIFWCSDYSISGKDGTIKLKLWNRGPENRSVAAIKFWFHFSNKDVKCLNYPPFPITVESNKSKEFIFQDCEAIKKLDADREILSFNISYTTGYNLSENVLDGEMIVDIT